MAASAYDGHIDELYRQIQDSFGLDPEPGNPAAPPRPTASYAPEDNSARYSNEGSRQNPRPLPNPGTQAPQANDGRPRPLPRPPPPPPIPGSSYQAQQTSSYRPTYVDPPRSGNGAATEQAPSVKRLPTVPMNGAPSYPVSAYPDSDYVQENVRLSPGAALYASAVPPSRRSQPQSDAGSSSYPNGGGGRALPVIDVVPSSQGYSPGRGPVYDGRSPPGIARSQSAASYAPSNGYQESLGLPNQRVAQARYDNSQGPASLGRSESANSATSSLLPGAPAAADRISLMSTGLSRTDSYVTSPAQYEPSLSDQQSNRDSGFSDASGYTVMPSPQPAFEYFPPNGADVKVSTYQLQQQFQSHQFSPNEKASRSGQYDAEDSVPRRLVDDHRLTERFTDLKRSLGKLDAEVIGDEDEYVPDHLDVLDGEYFDEEEEEDDWRFINLALLSHIAVRLRDKVPRSTHVKGSIPYPRAFTGKEVVSTIQSIIQRELLITLGISTNDRRMALQVARSLQNQLFFYEVEWGGRSLSDSVEDVFMFLDDDSNVSVGEGGSSGGGDMGLADGLQELPTGVITLLTKCYAPSCGPDSGVCYSYGCPRRGQATPALLATPAIVVEPTTVKRGWKQMVSQEIIDSIGEREVRRQNIIFKMVEKEEHYIQDLDFIETNFIKAIRKENPPVIPGNEVDSFLDDVFGNVLDLRETNKRLLENLYVRQREQRPVIQRVGDVFLTAATEFSWAYPRYVGHLPIAEKRLKDEIESNAEFRLFLERAARHPDSRRLDLRHFITRPSDHLKNYPVLLEAAMKETDPENPDVDFLREAAQAIRNLSDMALMRTFQSGMAKIPNAPKEWHQLVPKEVMEKLPKKEQKKQSIIFELIYGEMEYVRDLETIDRLYVQPLREANPPVFVGEKLDNFIRDAYWNFAEIHSHHKRLLERLHEIQREEHPVIRSITAPIYDAALNWRDAYMEYVPHYPISAYRIDEQIADNEAFRAFHEATMKNPESRKQKMKDFVFRPIPRLLRYDLLLKAIKDTLPPGDEDNEAIPQVLDLIKDLGKATESGVTTAKEKVSLWNYNANIVFKTGEAVDMDLLDDTRTLVHTGRLLRQPDGSLDMSGWSELFVLLFDNYLVMTKPKERDGVTKYYVNKRPIPLELLSLVGFTEVPQQRSAGLFRGLRSTGGRDPGSGGANEPMSQNGVGEGDSRTVYPCSIHHAGRVGGLYHLFAETLQIRSEWKQKLEEAISLRSIVQESNKVFEMRNLSEDTFVVPSFQGSVSGGWSGEMPFTGKVTCSVPFATSDGRGLVAVGCAEGVWIGLRSDAKSLRRVLHLKMVTQCAMLEDFGIFLVLADKSLFAYHIEALVPSSTAGNAGGARTPQKLNGNKDVQFFSVGTLNGRTLIIYMKKKGLDSVFRVLEPVIGKITEKVKNPGTFSRSIFGNSRSEWFRVYRDFFLPSESFDLVFLKAKIAILCTKGFEIMDLTDFKSVTIPQRDDPRLASLAKRCESCRPMGMFRSSENEFLLCYDEFGLFVDRHGDPNRTNGVIEWEGTAERVAFHPPYVVIFDSRFIEIRHIDKGSLVQIIRGTDLRCLWDGRGASIPPISTPGPGGWDETSSLESRIHAVMKAPDPQPNNKVVVQHVFELVPTVPLYVPPPLNSPSNGTYFPQNGAVSPPHSPRNGGGVDTHLWR
ncbi:hypothetical protein FRB94_012777 [Tulasnella sp. JGI-2019a]|nr:hypothetical protein FRB94_012777 [Tulasnella sp. JGI-2019a]KAG9018490.1 hypothetical protein FRB93_000193 [Tulasnella sp. JGI-2019a]KAG9037481.1 hypothetical protein FRB95_005420 [Tulasnella sp. JGI-2019a]